VISATVTIREARPEEFAAVADLTEAAYRAVGDDVLDEYVEELRDVPARAAAACPVLVAIDGETGGLLGTVTYVPGPGNPFAEAERDDEAGFRMLAVSTAAQGRGVGRALVEAVVARARDDGRKGIAIYTRPSMAAAHRLYASLGFSRDPDRDWEFEPGEWLWALSLRL
jgi:ribosomal protein S18 acetylase RimI-like enzyme